MLPYVELVLSLVTVPHILLLVSTPVTCKSLLHAYQAKLSKTATNEIAVCICCYIFSTVDDLFMSKDMQLVGLC